MATDDIPSRGIFYTSLSQLNPLEDYFHFTSGVVFHIFPLEVLLFNFH